MTHSSSPAPDLNSAAWRTSSYSGGQGDCVEVATNLGHQVPVRDTKHPQGPVITVTHDAWVTFLAHLG
ncbi:DUF397 domain-containing protein [Streptomyces sp. NA04227]|uniref:DUF397 domain-containing protein n=1 Tax=Streptomyces sp. NA04227 TaxID=2742136 RepID=UPI00158FC891|nr:DUF397 domain-containing protein [Streptomyces sp. NA04227]QKW09076.1 DUF397 domain-containing protein [Streptomyces sp. NA04227]